MSFTETLSSAMARKNINQKKLAEILGCTQALVSQYLSGKKTPASFKMLSGLAGFLDIETKELWELISSGKEALNEKGEA